MCRLFGLLSVLPLVDTSTDLLQSPCSLRAQSDADPERKQPDGWGIAWHQNKGATVLKTQRPLYKEESKLKKTLKIVGSPAVLAHIRHASNPMGIARHKLLGSQNSQPFIYKHFSFVHNGSLNIPREMRHRLGSYEQKVRGVNDSEILFWLLMKHIEKCRGDTEQAFKECVAEIWETWRHLNVKPQHISQPYSGLNIILSNGREIWAQCKYDGVSPRKDTSLCQVEPGPIGEMRYYQNPHVLKIASERTNLGPGWQPLKDGTLLHGWISNQKIYTKTIKLPDQSQ